MVELAFSYVVGNAINQTTIVASNDKNAVPFLVKMPLALVSNEAMTAFWRDHKSDKPARDLITQLTARIVNHPFANPKTWTKNLGVEMHDLVQRAPIIHGDVSDFVINLFLGGDARSVAPVTLKGPDPISTALDPEKKKEKGLSLFKKSKRTPTLADNLGGQKGVPLELRAILTAPPLGGLWKVWREVLDSVRRVNAKHAPDKG
jgi:hypothetical protein